MRPIRADLAQARESLEAAWKGLTEADFPADYHAELALIESLPDASGMVAMYIAAAIDTLATAQQVIRQIEGERIIQLRRGNV